MHVWKREKSREKEGGREGARLEGRERRVAAENLIYHKILDNNDGAAEGENKIRDEMTEKSAFQFADPATWSSVALLPLPPALQPFPFPSILLHPAAPTLYSRRKPAKLQTIYIKGHYNRVLCTVFTLTPPAALHPRDRLVRGSLRWSSSSSRDILIHCGVSKQEQMELQREAEILDHIPPLPIHSIYTQGRIQFIFKIK